MTEKGNTYNISNDEVEFDETTGDGVIYYQYQYTERNRLESVYFNEEW